MSQQPTSEPRQIAYLVRPFTEWDGGESWTVQERVNDPANGYFRRQIVSYHQTFADAMAAVSARGETT